MAARCFYVKYIIADASLHRCSKCGLVGDASNFHRDKKRPGGRTCWCKTCYRIAGLAYYTANRQRLVANAVAYVQKRRAESAAVREKDRIASRERKRRKHADPIAYAEHLRRGREWRANNPDKVRQFKHMSKERRCARVMLRYAQKVHACPSWADRAAIAAIYEECRRMNDGGPVCYEVDHIVPLLGKNVCGLHVHYNLQIIPAEVNRAKGNRLIEPLATT